MVLSLAVERVGQGGGNDKHNDGGVIYPEMKQMIRKGEADCVLDRTSTISTLRSEERRA